MMDKEYFMNAAATMPISWNGLNCSASDEQQQSFLSDHNFSHFDCSMVSSPAATTTSGLSNDAFALHELIGKLGGVGSLPSPYIGANSNNTSTNNSTPLSSPPILDHMKNMPNFGNSTPLLPSLSADPGFAERAAKFSCFGSRSFNGRTPQLGLLNNNGEMLQHRSGSPLKGNGKLPRVSSSPSFKHSGLDNKNLGEIRAVNGPKLSKLSGSCANSNEESSVSEQIPSGETSIELNSKKRKVVSKGKALVKGIGDGNGKRCKPTDKIENVAVITEDEEETKGGGGGSSNDDNQKPPEPPKDYIHVRARRGQATDSHSLAERVRREKISERMKLLQDIVPGCNKVTGKALMLDEIINYVQSLQRQVEFLSMKLASVNPELDFNMDSLLSKDMFQQNSNLPHQMYPLDPSSPAFYNHQNPNLSSQNPVDPLPLDAQLCSNLGLQLPSLDGFNQFPGFGEDDLHSIVQMGFGQNPVPNQTSDMKVER